MGSTEVTILGQKYTIKGDAPEDHIIRLASFVDEKLKEVHKGSPTITPLKTAILASLNIADELYKLKDLHDRETKNIEEKTNVLTGLFD